MRHSLGGALLAATMVIMTLGGCHGRSPEVGSLRCESLGNEAIFLPAEYETVVYSREEDGQTSFILADVSDEAILDGSARSGQIMHIELLWEPKGGATPLDDSATNVCIRHVILVDGELGLYGGAGFAQPSGDPDDDVWSIAVRDSSVRLLESTPGFKDPLGPARIVGRFRAIHEPARTRHLHRGVSQLVTDALERSRIVDATRASEKEQRPG